MDRKNEMRATHSEHTRFMRRDDVWGGMCVICGCDEGGPGAAGRGPRRPPPPV